MIEYRLNEFPRCECHECTQARWKMHGVGSLSGTIKLQAPIAPNVFVPTEATDPKPSKH